MSIGPSESPKVREGLIFRQLDEEWVVYDPSGEQLHVMNGSAAIVWLHCDGEFTVSEMIEEVYKAYEQKVDHDRVESDVGEVIEQFAAKGLLE